MKTIDISKGLYASHHYLTDFYDDSLAKLREAIESGEDFDTEWFGCKKEINYAKYTKANGQFLVEVDAHIDDLWEGDDLIYDALWHVSKKEEELPDEIIDSIKEAALWEVDDHTKLETALPYDADLDDIIKATDELESRCMTANDGMFDTLCDIVKAHVDYMEQHPDKYSKEAEE